MLYHVVFAIAMNDKEIGRNETTILLTAWSIYLRLSFIRFVAHAASRLPRIPSPRVVGATVWGKNRLV